MSALTLSHLSWSTPEGRALFSDLTLNFGTERTGLVGRNGVGKTTLLRIIAGETAPLSGTVAGGGRPGILRQTVQIGPDETLAGLFGVREALAVLRKAETGQANADELAKADWTLESRMADALARVGLNAAADTPLAHLSGGQCTRASLAALVFAEPDVLLLDEPTNNLDREGRQAVIGLLSSWKKSAVVVSHDRELLERMDAIVELTSLGATRYGGNWSHYRARKALEREAARHDLAEADKNLAAVERKAQATAERQARRDKAGRKKGAKGDMPRILIGKRIENSENTSAGTQLLTERRRAQAAETAAAARARIEVLQPLSVTIPSTNLAAGKTVLRLDHVTAGYARPIVRDFSLMMTGPERVAVVGPNGAGKTTLLSLITGALRPWEGTVHVGMSFALLDQQVSLLDPALSIRDNFRRLNPEADENACRAVLARFMFRADAALQIAGTLSGGQMLRAGLACVFGGTVPPSLLILDEPTNHLDIDSVETIEAGLRAYDGALLVVSHDEAFLDNIGIHRRVPLAPPDASGAES